MKPNSCEALPGNYRLSRTIDFVNMSRENVIGLLLTLVLLVVPVLLVLPSHPFSLMFSAQNAFFSLLYCAGAFLLMVLSMRLQAKLHGFCLFKTCDCPVEYVSMGFYLVACTGRIYVRRNAWHSGICLVRHAACRRLCRLGAVVLASLPDVPGLPLRLGREICQYGCAAAPACR